MKSKVIENEPLELEIVVDDGRIALPVRNKIGEQIGTFYFNPTDVGMIERFNEVAAKMPEIFKPLENINIAVDGSTDDGDVEAEAIMREAKNKLYESCNYLFGGDLAAAFFSGTHPFSPLANGTFYCQEALEQLGKFIEKQFQRNVKSISTNVSKYTSKYKSQPGKHRKVAQ